MAIRTTKGNPPLAAAPGRAAYNRLERAVGRWDRTERKIALATQSGSVLAIDVGNTSTVIGIADPVKLTVGHTWRLSSRIDRTADEWRILVAQLMREVDLACRSIEGAVVASVVPRITSSIARMIDEWCGFPPLVVDASSDLGVAVRVDRPEEVGADRLANAAAAYRLGGGPVVVVDAGTATKIDVVSTSGEFLGGVIAPGIGVGLEALSMRAARLYAVEIVTPSQVIGRNTIEAVQSGLVIGHVAMVEGIVARIRQEIGSDAEVITTGGYGPSLVKQTSILSRLEPHLTLVGAALVWGRKQQRVPESRS